MERRVFDVTFKRMAIDLSYARGSVKEVADGLGIDLGRLNKWRQKDSSPVRSATLPSMPSRRRLLVMLLLCLFSTTCTITP